MYRSEEHTSELQSRRDLVCRLLLEKKKEVEQQVYQEGNCDGGQGVLEEVNYLGNQNNYQGGYQNNYQQGYQNRPFTSNYGNNNLSYRSNNVANPQDQYYPPRAPQGNQFQQRPYGNTSQQNNAPWRPQGVQGQSPTIGYQGENKFRPQGQGQPRLNTFPPAQASEQDDMKSMMREIMEGQARVQNELIKKLDGLERKVDSNHGESQAKFEDIYSHLKNLDNQIAQVASSSQRPAESLHGKPDQNPTEYFQDIILRRG